MKQAQVFLRRVEALTALTRRKANMKVRRLLLGAAIVAAFGVSAMQARATITLTGPTPSVSENFDTLVNTGTSQPWTNNSTLSGWELYRQPSPGTAITTINAGTGTSNSGSFYSFGADSVAERALGGVGSGGAYFGSPPTGGIAGWIAVGLTNGTGLMIDSFDLSYDGEQWRNGGNTTAQTMVMEYGFAANFVDVPTWTAAGAGFDFTSPIATATAAALDGNDPANRVAGIGGTVGSLSWADGDTLWVRWVEVNDSGSDHGLAIDNFALSAHTVPEPATLVLVAFGALACVRRRR